MKITDALLGEHAVLYEMFDLARQGAAEGTVAGMRLAVLALEKLLVSHARVEEEILFPALEPHIGHMGPLTVMRAEHHDIEDLIARAKGIGEPAAFKETIARLLDVAAGHFHKEEMALFPMAKRFLAEEILEKLGDDWAQRRRVNIHAQGCMG